MAGNQHSPAVISFGSFEADLHTQELRKQGVRLRLPGQSFHILSMLLEHPGELVTREELQQALWPSDTHVDFERGVNAAVNRLRDILGDSAENPIFIETLPRRGYRFIAPVPGLSGKDVHSEDNRAPLAVALPPSPVPKPPAASTLLVRNTLLTLAALTGALLAIVVLGSFGTYFIRKSSWYQKGQAPRKIQLAVLPFVNLSGDPNQEYFSDGMTEEMITQLGKLDPERLGVIARTSAMLYKSVKKSTPQICHELGVDYILEGSVRRADNRARMTAQLIQCSDQTHLWGDSFERDIVNILALQADVAGQIAQRIDLQLTPQQQRSSKNVKLVIPEAYYSYLQGRFYSNQLTEDGLKKGIGYLEQAMHADSDYAAADAALADAYLLLGVFEYWPPQMAFPKAKAAASKALEIDPNSALAHSALGAVYDFYDWNWLAAAREYECALQLDPSDAWARLHTSNHLLITGRTAEAFSQLSRAIELDPLSFLINEQRALALFFTRDYDHSIEVSRKLLELEPNFILAREVLARAYEAKGMHEEAFDEWLKTFVLKGERKYADRLSRARVNLGLSGAQQLMARTNLQRLQGPSQRRQVPAIRFVWAYLELHDYDSAVDWLYRAYGERSSTLLYLKLDPGFDPLRSNPRFQELIRRIGLPP
jgi:TolB-like protein/DNA-binding winged helix-turn-helix (wHTH) protein